MRLKLIALAGALVATAAVALPATATRPVVTSASVTLCHLADGPAQAGKITVDGNAAYNAHYKQHSADIIPPFQYKGETYSLNWDAAGQATFNNGCVEPGGGGEDPVEVEASVQFIEGDCVEETPSLVFGSTEGVDYHVDGETDFGSTVTVHAMAKDGYTLVGQTEFSHTFQTEEELGCEGPDPDPDPDPAPDPDPEKRAGGSSSKFFSGELPHTA